MVRGTYGRGSVKKLISYRDANGRPCSKKVLGAKRVESDNWFIFYRVNGRQIRECAGTSKMEAEAMLQRRMGEAGLGLRPAADVKQLRYPDIRNALMLHYENKGRYVEHYPDGTPYVTGLNHLDKFFGTMRVVEITSDVIEDYIAARRKTGAADPTIRRNLVILRSMFNLARKQKKLALADVPYFDMPNDSEPTGQYLDPETFANLLAAMPERLRPFLKFLYSTGCRVGAAKRITWAMVDKDVTKIEIPAALIKARQPLTIALAGPVLEPVAAMLRKMFRHPDLPVFTVTNLRGEWKKHCGALGLGKFDKKRRTYSGLRIHDLRCSAAVNLVEAGVPEDVVMKIGGWKTKAMFSRYNVMNMDRLRAAMERGGAHVAQRMAVR